MIGVIRSSDAAMKSYIKPLTMSYVIGVGTAAAARFKDALSVRY